MSKFQKEYITLYVQCTLCQENTLKETHPLLNSEFSLKLRLMHIKGSCPRAPEVIIHWQWPAVDLGEVDTSVLVLVCMMHLGPRTVGYTF